MNDGDYSNYTISTILEKVDRGYHEFIFSRSSQLIGQKTLPGISYSNSNSRVRELLISVPEFLTRFISMSEDAQFFYHSLFSRGRSWKLDKATGEGTELRLKDGVRECLDKLMVFALPSMEKPEVLIIPVEYALMGGPSAQRGSALSLASSLGNYTMKMLRKISKYYRISTSLPAIEAETDTYIKIVSNFTETIKNLNSGERKIMDYLMNYEGISQFPDLAKHFKMERKSSYYYSHIYFNDLFSSTAYSNSEPLISLLTKGLVFCTRGRYYDDVGSVYIPDEIAIEIRRMRLEERNRTVTLEKQASHIPPTNLVNYGEDYAADVKKVFTVIYYLQSRSKRRQMDAFKKYLSMPERDINKILDQTRREGWIIGNTSSMTIIDEGLKYIEDRNFSFNLKKYILEKRVFSTTVSPSTVGVKFLDGLRRMFLETIYRMKYPQKIGEVIEEMKSGENYFKLSRGLGETIVSDDNFITDLSTINRLKQNIVGDLPGWILEITLYLKKYGLIRLSSPDTTLETYIFPEQEFLHLFEKKGKVENGGAVKDISKPLKVLPNNDILIGIDADFKDIKMIADFSDLISADMVCTFRITKSSLSDYLNRMGKIDRIIPFLKKKSSVPVPDTVERLVKDVEKKEDEISITKCQAILQVNDRTIIDGIMKVKNVSELVEKRISPEILIIKEGVSLYRFVTELRKKGYVVPISIEKEKKRRSSRYY